MITMKSKLSRFPIVKLLLLTIAIACIPLIFSIIRSGYNYVFDTDELNHIQLTYLYMQGQRPYLDIYNSVYSPLFGWFFVPLFQFLGFTFSTIYTARYVMIILFFLRVGVSYLIVRKVFGRRIAFLFVPMFLVDPFVIFSSMQIRPDNLMMALYTFGLLFFVKALYKTNTKHMALAGALFSTSLLALPKILPSVGLVYVFAFFYFLRKKNIRTMIPLIAGFAVPVLLFCGYCLVTSSFIEMVRQMVLESRAAYSYFPISIPIGNFHIPGNFYVYGTMGKPVTWLYAWFLPFAACAGLFACTQQILKRRVFDAGDMTKLILAFCLLSHWATLFFLPVMFMQHFLPFSWLMAIFAAYAIDAVYTTLTPYRFGKLMSILAIYIFAMCLIAASVKNNYGRSLVDSGALIQEMTNRWQQIPAGTYTFPNYLFRPSMYPITYGYFIGNVPPVILDRLPSITGSLEKYDVKILLVDDYLMSKLPGDVTTYITDHYSRIPGDTEMMKRK